jgi:general secretion pathway protein M
MNAWLTARRAVMATWQQRAVRERRLIMLGALILLFAVLWAGLLGPAWHVWRQAPEQQARLETQTLQMLDLQAQARQLQGSAHLNRAEALKLLDSSAQAMLGSSAQLSLQGEELRVTLQAASAKGLAEWLIQAREKAQSLPKLVQLQQHEAPIEPAARTKPAAETSIDTTWNGILVLRLP